LNINILKVDQSTVIFVRKEEYDKV